MKVLLACCLFIVLFSCSESKKQEETLNDNHNEEIVAVNPVHNTTSTLSIEGMTCEIGCVRTVKSHLSKMNGVINIEMDFDTSRSVNFSTVDFDNNLISEQEMKEEIESIANGIYSVTEITQVAK